MPLTKFQARLAKVLASNRSIDSHLAGGAALNFSPRSHRFSNDLDYFQDSAERVATAFAGDNALLISKGYSVAVLMNQPAFVRCIVSKGGEETKVEWSHDSAWRFMPVIPNPDCGFQLHPIDLAINKVLALVGRNEPRDFVDTIFIMRDMLPLGALIWAAAGKDPGFTPRSLLEIIKRRGKIQREDLARLNLNFEPNLQQLKVEWLSALDSAEIFIESRPASEIGCLYYSSVTQSFVQPSTDQTDIILHWGAPGGVLPSIVSS